MQVLLVNGSPHKAKSREKSNSREALNKSQERSAGRLKAQEDEAPGGGSIRRCGGMKSAGGLLWT